MKKPVFTVIILLASICSHAQTNVSAAFACPGGVTVNYDLNASNPTDVTLYYSPDNGKTWLIAQTVTGDLTAQTTGSGKTIVWDNRADNVKFGQFKLKVEVPQNPKPECVEIAGVCWAISNVDAPGTFARNPEDAGMFYQWNRSKAWAATGTVTGWDNSTPTGTEWEKANDPCPTGYRVPTQTEQTALLNAGSTWTSDYNSTGVAGRIFGSGSNTVFLPAAGYRYTNGALNYAGTSGNYWSSTQTSIGYAYYVHFTSGAYIMSNYNCFIGLPVRCVKE